MFRIGDWCGEVAKGLLLCFGGGVTAKDFGGVVAGHEAVRLINITKSGHNTNIVLNI